ncbi:hypothetical protein Hanom_Chr05g00401371 [Helianthus anomalus]
MRKKDEEHKSVLEKMEESFNNAHLTYANMMAECCLRATVDDFHATKTWLLSEGAQLLAKNIHKGREMTVAVAAVNNTMSAVGVISGLHNGYLHALKLKTPYAEVPLLNRNAAEELDMAVARFDSLTFPVVEDLPKLINEPLFKIKEALSFANSGSSEK